jgi:hypothetical protein
MGKVFYVPFDDADLIQEAKTLCTNHANQGFEQTVKHHKSYNPVALDKIAGGDELYVGAHGHLAQDDPTPYVTSSSGDQLTPEELALRLWKERLPTEHRTIKLWICYGGVNPPGFGKAFASALYKQGYNRCEIFGYKDAIRAGAAGGHKRSELFGNASNVRVEVDNLSFGEKVARFFRVA